MKKTKIIGAALALALTVVPGVNTIIPFTGNTTICEISAAAKYEEGINKVITKNDPLNIRDSASKNGKVIGKIPKGYFTYAWGKPKNGFVQVSYGAIKGWASAEYLSKVTTKSFKPGVYKVNTENGNLNMRINPGTSYSVIESIKKGATVNVTKYEYTRDNLKWVLIKYNGKSGWVAEKFLSFLYG